VACVSCAEAHASIILARRSLRNFGPAIAGFLRSLP
jgi:hypothetical protein